MRDSNVVFNLWSIVSGAATLPCFHSNKRISRKNTPKQNKNTEFQRPSFSATGRMLFFGSDSQTESDPSSLSGSSTSTCTAGSNLSTTPIGISSRPEVNSVAIAMACLGRQKSSRDYFPRPHTADLTICRSQGERARRSLICDQAGKRKVAKGKLITTACW